VDLCPSETAPGGGLLARGLSTLLGCAANSIERKGRLVAQRRQVEVSALAKHQLICEGCDVGEGNGERLSARRNTEPISAARAVQETPCHHDVFAECHTAIIGREVRKGSEVGEVSGTRPPSEPCVDRPFWCASPRGPAWQPPVFVLVPGICIYVSPRVGSNGPGSEKPSIDATFA
jgi:hypothetical protein